MISAGSRLDNLVQIGHNVILGRCYVIVAQVGISGSTVLEDFVRVGGQAAMAGHIRIGQGAEIGAQAGLISDVDPGAKVLAALLSQKETSSGKLRCSRRMAKKELRIYPIRHWMECLQTSMHGSQLEAIGYTTVRLVTPKPGERRRTTKLGSLTRRYIKFQCRRPSMPEKDCMVSSAPLSPPPLFFFFFFMHQSGLTGERISGVIADRGRALPSSSAAASRSQGELRSGWSTQSVCWKNCCKVCWFRGPRVPC